MPNEVNGQDMPPIDATTVFGSLSFEPAATSAPGPAGLTPDVQAIVDALPATSAMLVVLSGPNAGSRFLLDSPSTVAGRGGKADILLDDMTVSRRHAEFLREGTRFSVHDLGSLNGTYVNGNVVDSAVLVAGDEVQIGKYRLTFQPSPHVGLAGKDQVR